MRKPQRATPVVIVLPARWKVAVWMELNPDGGAELFDSLLKVHALSRLRLAQSIGKTHTTINNIRKGESCKPETAHDIAAVLGVPTTHLFVERVSRIPVHEDSNTGRKVA